MGKEETAEAGTVTVTTGNLDDYIIYWNHAKTVLLIVATLSLYFCEMLLIVGGGAFARSIAAVVGGEGRKWFLIVPNIFGFVGSIVVARANTFGTIIAGFCIAGLAFGSQSLFVTVASEVLPRKYRSWAQAGVNAAVALGSIFSLSVGGYLTRSDPDGFRTCFYIVAGIYVGATAMCTLLYNSVPRELEVTLTTTQKLHSLDWAGYFLIASGTVLLCLGLSWAQNPYPWADAHVLAPFLIGAFLLILLIIYSWRIRKDGLLHHDLFHHRNFAISLVGVFIEGMAFMAANVYFPYTLGVLQTTTMSAFKQALCYVVAFCAFGIAALAAGFYIYKTRTVRIMGLLTFLMFLGFFISMPTVTATTPERNFRGFIPFYGLGLGICLVTFVTAAQFSTPPELIAVTSGLIFSIRSLGGSIGLAIFNAIFAHGLNQTLVPKISAPAIPLGLSKENIGALIAALTAGDTAALEAIPGITPAIIEAAGFAMQQAYVVGFRDVFVCGAAFSVAAMIPVAFLCNPSSELTRKIDAPIEIVEKSSDMESKMATEQRIENRELAE